jgi:hypothetical protein
MNYYNGAFIQFIFLTSLLVSLLFSIRNSYDVKKAACRHDINSTVTFYSYFARHKL